MSNSFIGNRFYQTMGFVLLGVIIAGFGMAAVVRGGNPLDLPGLFHLHGLVYLTWFGLFILQVSLIGKNNRSLHMTLGKLSVVLVVGMVVTGWLMAQGAYDRGVSPIPGTTIQQFTAFPIFDLLGLLVFYSLALAKRSDAEFHKRAMLLSLIAIIDPGAARIGISIGFPPFPLVVSVLLVAAVMWHDRKVLQRVHGITWFAFVWVFLRLGFVFGFATTESWSDVANNLFG